MARADEPRKAQLLASKKAAAQIKADAANATLALWEKQCPRCGAHLPARKTACACGYRFVVS